MGQKKNLVDMERSIQIQKEVSHLLTWLFLRDSPHGQGHYDIKWHFQHTGRTYYSYGVINFNKLLLS